MKSDEASPPYETLKIGTPKDYTTDVYKFYFELGEYQDHALKVLVDFLGDKNNTINKLTHGYEVELPIQCVPDIVSALSKKNIAIYQIVRYAKTNNVWA